ncbi:hypothetical protein HID58_031942, partial [Brassica napus]
MGTADPPDLPLSPTKVGSSLGEAQGTDRLVKNGGDSTEVLDLTKSMGATESATDGSSDLSLKALTEKQAQVPIKSKGSYAGVVQGEIRDDSLEKGKEGSKEKEKDQEETSTEIQTEKGLTEIQTMEVLDNGIATGENTPEAITKGNEWEDVSPGKASRSPRELEFGQVSILTKSRFSVLTPVEEGDPPENEDKQAQSGEDG